jgi:hypothetical protein
MLCKNQLQLIKMVQDKKKNLAGIDSMSQRNAAEMIYPN